MFQTKSYRKSKHTFCDINFFPENRAVYEIMWKNIAEMGRLQITIWRIRIACWITKATNTHSGCVMFFFFYLCNNGCTNRPQRYVIAHCLPCLQCGQHIFYLGLALVPTMLLAAYKERSATTRW